MTKILCNIINKKLSFSDDLLNFCWINGCNNGIGSNSKMSDDLSQTLLNTCNNIIVNGNKKDWYDFETLFWHQMYVPSVASFIFSIFCCMCL